MDDTELAFALTTGNNAAANRLNCFSEETGDILEYPTGDIIQTSCEDNAEIICLQNSSITLCNEPVITDFKHVNCEKEITNLKEALTEFNAKNIQLEIQVKFYQSMEKRWLEEKNKLQTEIDKKDQHIKLINEECLQYRKEVCATNSNNSALKIKLSDLKMDLDDVTEHCYSLKLNIADSDVQLNDLKKKLAQKEQDYKETQNCLQQSLQEKVLLQQSLNQFFEREKETILREENAKKLEIELREEKLKFSDIPGLIKTLESQLQQLHEENKKLISKDKDSWFLSLNDKTKTLLAAGRVKESLRTTNQAYHDLYVKFIALQMQNEKLKAEMVQHGLTPAKKSHLQSTRPSFNKASRTGTSSISK